MPADIAFAMLGVMTIGGALVAVGAGNLYRAVLGLMLCLVGMAGLFLLQRADFLAVAQVLIYVGGVAVLIVFAVILTEREGEPLAAAVNPRMVPAALILGAGLTAVLVSVLWRSTPAESPVADVTARTLAEALLNRYLVPFEAVSLLLLAALVGALLIAKEKES
ncbi:MAG: NADH-quinone oxidoreductase subunit J [Candidatus Coatesbacteria bacterium]